MIVRLKGVKRQISKGRVYWYYRPTWTRLSGEPGTAEFLASYAAAVSAKPQRSASGRPGTLGGLIVAYRASPAFLTLALRTRADYQKVFDWLQRIDAMPLASADEGFAEGLRDRAYRQHKRRFSIYVMQVMSRLWSWGRRWVDGNPFRRVEAIRRPADQPRANRPWSDAELTVTLARARPDLRLAIALGAYAGMREGDVIRVSKAADRGEMLVWRQGKTGNDVEVPVYAELRAILDAAPARPAVQLVTNSLGRPWKSGNAFRAAFFDLVQKLQREGAVGAGLTFHGLRHTAATRLAEARASDRAIAELLGHRSLVMARHYSETADRRAELKAAVRRMERISKAKSGKPGNTGGKP